MYDPCVRSNREKTGLEHHNLGINSLHTDLGCIIQGVELELNMQSMPVVHILLTIFLSLFMQSCIGIRLCCYYSV